MLQLAVTTDSITFDRMRDPLYERGIRVSYLDISNRVIPLAEHAPWNPDSYDVGYVYPSRLMEGGVADALLGLSWVNGRDAVLRSRNKAGVLAAAQSRDIPIPASVLVSNPVDDSDLVDTWNRFDGPAVVKPNSTTRGVGVARADDLDSFLGIVDYIDLVHDFRATGDKSFLVQEFIPDARDVRVMLIDGEYVGAVERRIPAADEADRWKQNVHRGATASGIVVEDRIRTLAEEVADFAPAAVLGVDLLVTPDAAYLSETNARPTIDAVSKYEPHFWDRLADAVRQRA